MTSINIGAFVSILDGVFVRFLWVMLFFIGCSVRLFGIMRYCKICCHGVIILTTYSWDFFFFFKKKTEYDMRISDWSSDVCSSDLTPHGKDAGLQDRGGQARKDRRARADEGRARPLHASAG